MQTIWGPDEIFSSRAPGLRGAVEIAGQFFPEYDLALIAIGPLVLAAIWLSCIRTRWGILIRAATQDSEMTRRSESIKACCSQASFFSGAFLLAWRVPADTEGHRQSADGHQYRHRSICCGSGRRHGQRVRSIPRALLIGQTHAFGILIFRH